MSLLTITPAQRIAAEIDSINTESVSFVRAQMHRAYALANTPGEQQAIMDVFGANATTAMTVYATLHAALGALGESVDLAAPDFQAFAPQPDGTVLFTPTPVEEVAPIQEPS